MSLHADDAEYAAWQAERDADRAYRELEGADRERQALHAEIDSLNQRLAAVTEERDAAEARFAEMHRLAGEYLLQRDAVTEERDRLAADLIGAEVVLRNLLVLIRGDRLAWASGFRKDASDWLDRRARAVLSDPTTPRAEGS